MCRSVPGERSFYGVQSYPPLISRLRASFPPRGSLLQEFFRTTQQSDDRSKYARPHPSPAAPLRGSTPRQCLILRLDFRYLCRSAQDDTEEDRTVGYNPYVVKVT